MTERILFVDDDELILGSWERTLRRQFTVETAIGPMVALEKIAQAGPYAVIVSDMRMPEMNGLELLRRARELSPGSVHLILTGNADLLTAIEAVNEGNIFRFLEKPCANEMLAKVLMAALDQYRMQRAEKDLLEKTLHGSIKVLTEVLGLVNPEAFSTASRIALYAKHISAHLKLKDSWRFEMAALLSQLGCVVIPTETLEAVRLGRKLSKDQEARFVEHPRVGAGNLLRNIPRLESIASMVARQQEPFSQSNAALADPNEEALGAQILKVCIKFEASIRSGMNHVAVIDRLWKSPDEYNPVIVTALAGLPAEVLPCEPRVVAVSDLTCQMVLDDDLRTKEGTLLVAKGIELTETLLMRIHNFHQRGSVANSISVLVPVSLKKWYSEQASQATSDRVKTT